MRPRSLLALAVAVLGACAGTPPVSSHDVVVYGGTSAGVITAVRLARAGRDVVLVAPEDHLGGMTTNGLGMTDAGDKRAIGGLSREFYRRVGSHYDAKSAWRWQKRKEFRPDPAFRFEPHVAEAVFGAMVREAGVPVLFEERLQRPSGVRRVDQRITSIRLESGRVLRARLFVDATYEGDLMAGAGVSYRVGREANAEYGETLNGVQTKRARYHQFRYPLAGGPAVASGALKIGEQPGVEGAGDHRVQAYCFRLCTTDVPENRMPFPKPAGYDPARYELLLRYAKAGVRAGGKNIGRINGRVMLWYPAAMPNRKTDTNNNGPFSFDHIGANYAYPDADYATRALIVAEHERYQKGLLWFLGNDPRVPQLVRDQINRYGLAKDEFVRNGHWPRQLYIREARRMVGTYVQTEHDCLRTKATPQPVGLGSYNIDSHNVQRYVDAQGHVRNEGDVQVSPGGAYAIGYGALCPKRAECTNLLVPVCLSATHAAYGSIRMEPVFMVLGHAVAVAADLALDGGVAVQDVAYPLLRARLLAEGQVLAVR